MSTFLWIGLILTGFLVFFITLISYEAIERHTVQDANWAANQLDLMFIPISQKHAFRILMLGPFILGVLAFLVFWSNTFVGLLAAILSTLAGFKMPRPFIEFLLKSRTRKLNMQLVDGLTLMANSLRSGLSLMQTLQIVVEEMPNPLSQEMNLVLSEQRIGVSAEKSFQNFAARMKTEDVEMFVTAVIVLRETGGNLAETFDTIVHTIRERLKLENKISAITAQGVWQGRILTFAPFVLMLALNSIDPSHMQPLFTTLPGYVLLAIMLTLIGVGAFMIKKIVTIRI
ncbi:MAG: type II secretion system F family protein [Deltaproteobacteria bacterium]|nr:type II secretion system F family protein [Deltaproteobacteria bacterium]